MHQDHIHRLTGLDNTVLCASQEFPTFTDAFARVVQVVLPVLEAEAGEIALFHNDKDASHDMAVSFCLPALAWDITRTRAFPLTDKLRRSNELAVRKNVARSATSGGAEEVNHVTPPYAALEPLERLASICTDVSVSVSLLIAKSATAGCDVCPTDEFINWSTAADCERSAVATQHSLRAPQPCFLVRALVPETRWHCGQQMQLPERKVRRNGSVHHGQSSVGGDANSGGSFLCLTTVCRVRGLFHSLPVRQAPFAPLIDTCSLSAITCNRSGDGVDGTCKSTSESNQKELARSRVLWARKSASAMRVRREEQQNLMEIVFQIAACTLLAPLYLVDTHLDASEGTEMPLAGCTVPVPRASMFSAQLITDCDFSGDMGLTRCEPAQVRPLRALSLSKAPRCTSAPCTGRGGNGTHADPTAAAGLCVDRHGLFKGTLRVLQEPREGHVDQRRAPRRTRGEATAYRLCRAFGISPPKPPSARAELHEGKPSPLAARRGSFSSSAWCSEEGTGGGELTEIVVRPGLFSVLFATPPPLDITASATPKAPSTADSFPLVSLSRRQTNLTMIIVRDDPAHTPPNNARRSLQHPLSSALRQTHFHVLEATHWAYNIIAANAHRRHHSRCLQSKRSISTVAVMAVPVFVFVDGVYVPPRISEARHAHSAPDTFAQLYDEALQLLAGSSRRYKIGEDPLGDLNYPLGSTNPPPASMSNERQQSSIAPNRVLMQQENAKVQLRMRYLCQQVLEAAAVPGTQVHTPVSPSGTSKSLTGPSVGLAARTGALQHVRINPASLLQWGSPGHTVNPSAAVAAPRRTPVTLDPNMDRVAREEKEIQAALRNHHTIKTTSTCWISPGAAQPPPLTRGPTTEEQLTQIRYLLDTGRGHALRRLPHACAPPRPWTPMKAVNKCLESEAALSEETRATAALQRDAPPITTVFSADVSVLQWARKFLILACPTTPLRHAVETPNGPARVPPQALAHRPHPHAFRWWVADQHAVHERVRLEFFLCFADTYVCHPELQRGMQKHTTSERVHLELNAGSERAYSPSSSLSPQARSSLEHRHRIAQLLSALTLTDPDCSQGTPLAAASFPVSLPDEWRLRVTAVEGHLRQWGWRFHHKSLSVVRGRDTRCRTAAALGEREHVALATAVLTWPCLSVEGAVHHFTSMQILKHTVEELEAVGAAANGEVHSTSTAPPISPTDPVYDCNCPQPLRPPRLSPTPPLIIPSVFLDFFVSRSCRGAVMFGDVLHPTATRSMVAALDCVEQLHLCSHGRPSFTLLTPAE